MGDRLATTDMDRKLGAVLLWGGGYSSNKMWPGPRPTPTPSGILIHPTVWPQYTSFTDRQSGQTDNGPIAQGEPLYKQSPKNIGVRLTHADRRTTN